MRKVDQAARYDKGLNTWIKPHGGKYRLGLTDWAQGYMSTIHQLEFHVSVGQDFANEALFVTLSSDKITTDVHLPLACSIIKINEALFESPSLINEDCYNTGWMLEVSFLANESLGQLESAQWYEDSINSFFKKGS